MVGRAKGVGIIVELQVQQVGDFFLAGGALDIAADVLVQLAQAARHLAHVLISLRDRQGGGKIFVGNSRGQQLVSGVKLPGEFTRLLLLNGAQRFQQGESVIRQGDGFGVIGVLFALDPAALRQAAQQVGSVIGQVGIRVGEHGGRRLGLLPHLGSHLRLGAGALEVVDNLGDDRLAPQAKAVELRQGIDAQQEGHVVALQTGIALRAEKIEQVGGQDIEGVAHRLPSCMPEAVGGTTLCAGAFPSGRQINSSCNSQFSTSHRRARASRSTWRASPASRR